jgi:ribonuclease R
MTERRKKDLADRINDLLGGAAIPLSKNQIASQLKFKGKEKKKLEKVLNRLVSEGQLLRLPDGKYSPGAPADLAAGTIRFLRSGEALVATEGDFHTVRTAKDGAGTALPGDRVLIRYLQDGQGRKPARDLKNAAPRGEVVRVLERKCTEMVGTLKSTKNFLYVSTLDPSFKHDFYITDRKNAKPGDRVLIRFIEWHNRNLNPEAEIIEVLGREENASLDTIAVLRNFSIRDEFPPKVLEEASAGHELAADTSGRTDLRNKTVITIDPERARDFDDALSLETDKNGNRVLGVHIADVSHFVRKGGELDMEAAERGNSVYLPDKVVPMLPEELSNNVCSLMPNVERLAFSAFITFDGKGNAINSEFTRSVIRSDHRFTYREVLELLKDGGNQPDRIPGRITKLVKGLDRLAKKLRKQRLAKNALDFDLPETEIVVGRKGYITEIRKVAHDESHQLVEECMLAANEAVATRLAENKYPVIYRIHEPPRPEKLEEVSQELASMGYTAGNLASRRNLARLVNKVKGDPLEQHVHIAILRCMNRAIYSTRNTGHFGLAKDTYTHFTSPIRRYTDLVIHRQLGSLLRKGSKPAYGKSDISEIAMKCTATEQIAEEAETAVTEIKKYRYLAQELKKKKKPEHKAVVVKVTSFGMFVELEDIDVQGLVHISDISRKYVRFDRQNQALRAGKKAYKLGSELKVRVASVNFEERKLDFKMAW